MGLRPENAVSELSLEAGHERERHHQRNHADGDTDGREQRHAGNRRVLAARQQISEGDKQLERHAGDHLYYEHGEFPKSPCRSVKRVRCFGGFVKRQNCDPNYNHPPPLGTHHARGRKNVTTDSADLKTVASFPSKPEARPASHEDMTFEFVSEAKLKEPPRRFPVVVKARKPTLIAVMVALGVLALAGGVTAALALRAPVAPTGSLSIETDPAGAEVRIDDAVRGMSPLTLSLAEGRHRLVVRRGSDVKEMDVDITSSTARSYHIEWAASAPA